MLNQGKAAIGRASLLFGIVLGLVHGSLFAANNGNGNNGNGNNGNNGLTGNRLNTYLALGDSVAFGLDIRLLLDPSNPPSPSQFVGYPEIIGSIENLPPGDVINPSCPGATSGSFITAGAADYGCYSPGPQGQPPFTGDPHSVGLHVNYTTSQLQFAISQLISNPQINLVSLGIGSNDVLVALRTCNNAPACVGAALPGVLGIYAQNLGHILHDIRQQYHGTLVLVKYYSPAPAFDQIAINLNDTMAAVGANFNVKFADGFTAFQIASAPFGGDACRAGLLVPLPAALGGGCDIHPTRLGSAVLAAAVEAARLGH